MLKHVDFTHCSAFTQTFKNRVTLTSTVTQLAPSMQPAAVFCGFAPLSHNKTKSIKAVSQKWQLRKSAPSSFSLLFALPMKSWNQNVTFDKFATCECVQSLSGIWIKGSVSFRGKFSSSIFVLITCRSRQKFASCKEDKYKTASCGAALCCLSRNLFHAINAKRIKYLKPASRKLTINQPQRGVSLLTKDAL